MTIVGLIPPVYENGDLLIDGGYVNNMPVDVMRGLGVDTVRAHAYLDTPFCPSAGLPCQGPRVLQHSACLRHLITRRLP